MKINTNNFHALWSKAVGTPDYDKSQWMKLDSEIANANREIEPKKKESSTFDHRSDAQIFLDATHNTSFGMK